MRSIGVSCYQQWLGRKTEHGYHNVPITCSAGRGLGKVSAAVTRGRRLLRCLVHLDCLDWDLLSHSTTWGERGAHESMAQQGYRHSWPCESPLVLLWPHTAPQRGFALCWGRLAKSSTWQKPGPKSRPKPALSWHAGAKEGLAGLQGSREKRKGHSSFCPAPRHGSGCLVSSSPFLAPPRHSIDDVGRRGPRTCPQHCPCSASPARIISLHQAEL